MRCALRFWRTASVAPPGNDATTSTAPRSLGSSRRAISLVPRTATHWRRCADGSLSAASHAITSNLRTL